ncbi:release factor glutamine methyltransferase [Dysgonomonadaceae bacterium PH5-43]|nr:release factor glutamine methyltransferase [Dysgonomonadaceae bacterium PH5-43]
MQTALLYIKESLKTQYSESEIQSLGYLLLQYICKKDKHTLLRDKDKQLSANETQNFHKFVEELKLHRPIQYVLGSTEFYNLMFKVNESVLIPRPETEELVDLILGETNKTDEINILDIGTGSGCIAISLAKNLPAAKVFAVDVSEEALIVAADNVVANNVKITLLNENILNLEPNSIIKNTKWDIIVSNPPYIVPSEKKIMKENVLDYEPNLALFVPEEQPLLFYEAIASLGLTSLSEKGKLYFETSAMFGKQTLDMLLQKGYSAKLFQDISGKDRMIKAYLQ